MDLSNDYIAFDYIGNFQRTKDVLPYKQYSSGAKNDDTSLYRNPVPSNSNPVLLLEFDILNNEGFGLKRGFYEIRPDGDYTFLMFIQAGEIKAKIPVISSGLISHYGSDYEWPDKKDKKLAPKFSSTRLTEENDIVSSKNITPALTDKQLKKRDYKYKKGLDPIEHIHSKVEMTFDKELQSYVVVWEKYNTRVTGVLKLK